MSETFNQGMLSVKELATYMGVSLSVAYRLVNSEGFPVLHLGKRLLVPIEELRAWIARQTTEFLFENKDGFQVVLPGRMKFH